MLTRDTVRRLRELEASGAGIRRIAVLLGISRNTVRRYVRPDIPTPTRVERPWRDRAAELYLGPCLGNAAAVARALRSEGFAAEERAVQRVIREMKDRGELYAGPVPASDRAVFDAMPISVGYAE